MSVHKQWLKTLRSWREQNTFELYIFIAIVCMCCSVFANIFPVMYTAMITTAFMWYVIFVPKMQPWFTVKMILMTLGFYAVMYSRINNTTVHSNIIGFIMILNLIILIPPAAGEKNTPLFLWIIISFILLILCSLLYYNEGIADIRNGSLTHKHATIVIGLYILFGIILLLGTMCMKKDTLPSVFLLLLPLLFPIEEYFFHRVVFFAIFIYASKLPFIKL